MPADIGLYEFKQPDPTPEEMFDCFQQLIAEKGSETNHFLNDILRDLEESDESDRNKQILQKVWREVGEAIWQDFLRAQTPAEYVAAMEKWSEKTNRLCWMEFSPIGRIVKTIGTIRDKLTLWRNQS